MIDSIILAIKSGELANLHHLYMIIRHTYKNDEIVINQFLQATKKSLLLKQTPPFTSFPPVFTQFYSQLVELINLTVRSDIIQQSLQMDNVLTHIVSKYDYYFSGVVIDTIHLNVGTIHRLSSVDKFILVYGDKQLTIWDTLISKTFYFNSQQDFLNIDKCILYEENKFAVSVDIQSEDDIVGTYIYFLDFNTGQQTSYTFTDQFRISDIKVVEPNSIGVTGNERGLCILNIHTLQEEYIPHTPLSFCFVSIKTKKGVYIIVGGLRSVRFVNTNRSVKSLDFGTACVSKMELIGTNKLICMTSKEIGLINYKTRQVLKIVNEQRIIDFITRKSHIILRTQTGIYIFTSNLNLKAQKMFTSPILYMSFFPDNTLLAISEKELRIFKTKKLKRAFTTTHINGLDNVLFKGTLYGVKKDQIVAYH